jgi:hypothetical protein
LVTLVGSRTVAKVDSLAVVIGTSGRDLQVGGALDADPITVGWLASHPARGHRHRVLSVQSLRTCTSKKLPLGPWNSVLRLGYGGASWA